MGNRIGIVAGSGEFPFLIVEEVRKQGLSPVVAGIIGEAGISLKEETDVFEWIDAGNMLGLVSFFKKNGVKEAVFAGKVNPRAVYRKENLDEASQKILAWTQKRVPSALIQTIIEYMKDQGIQIVDPRQFIAHFFCEVGILTATKPSPDVEEDIEFGWKVARSIADLDIGQTAVVKERTIAAVEGIEGTDQAIRRGGQLAGEGTVVVKVSRTFQDPRVDLPAVGLKTIRSLIDAQSRALCFEAQSMPFFQKKESVSLADAHEIAIVARKL